MNKKCAVISAPAPWRLRGRGYISVLRHNPEISDDDVFLPLPLHGQKQGPGLSFLMFVDYVDSPVGPYHELLYIPGRYRLADGKTHFTISRIFVSSMDSVVNGRANWGIPKELAQFDVDYGKAGIDRVSLSKDGQCFARLQYKNWPVPLPLPASFTPASWRSLVQFDNEQSFVYAPSANGLALPAKLQQAWFDSTMFPALSVQDVLFSVKLSSFNMRFPNAQVQAVCRDGRLAHAR